MFLFCEELRKMLGMPWCYTIYAIFFILLIGIFGIACFGNKRAKDILTGIIMCCAFGVLVYILIMFNLYTFLRGE